MMIQREEYREELKKWKDKDLIKVVTGIRRCGKSTLFELFVDYLKGIGIKDKQIININLEDPVYQSSLSRSCDSHNRSGTGADQSGTSGYLPHAPRLGSPNCRKRSGFPGL